MSDLILDTTPAAKLIETRDCMRRWAADALEDGYLTTHDICTKRADDIDAILRKRTIQGSAY